MIINVGPAGLIGINFLASRNSCLELAPGCQFTQSDGEGHIPAEALSDRQCLRCGPMRWEFEQHELNPVGPWPGGPC